MCPGLRSGSSLGRARRPAKCNRARVNWLLIWLAVFARSQRTNQLPNVVYVNRTTPLPPWPPRDWLPA